MANLEAQIKALQTSHTNQVQDLAQLKSDLQSISTEMKNNLEMICQKIQTQATYATPQRAPKDSFKEAMPNESIDYPSYAQDYLTSDHESTKNMKFIMPRFNGEDVRGWLFTSQRYFIYYKIPDN